MTFNLWKHWHVPVEFDILVIDDSSSFQIVNTVLDMVHMMQAYSSPLEDPQLLPGEKKLIVSNCISKQPAKSIPWRSILSKPPVWALIVSHFCHNWGTFILLTWMPTYYHQVYIC